MRSDKRSVHKWCFTASYGCRFDKSAIPDLAVVYVVSPPPGWQFNSGKSAKHYVLSADRMVSERVQEELKTKPYQLERGEPEKDDI